MTETLSSAPNQTRARVNGYAVLSACYRCPDKSLQKLLTDEWAWSTIDPALKPISTTHSCDLEMLKTDYARLFVGPFELLAPPYAGIYLDKTNQIMTESTHEIEQIYKQEGLAVEFDEPPDHIAVELEFIQYLLQKEIIAAEQGNGSIVKEYKHKRSEFLDQYLRSWADAFTNKIEEHAESEFYRTLAQRTRIFLYREDDL